MKGKKRKEGMETRLGRDRKCLVKRKTKRNGLEAGRKVETIKRGKK